MDERGEAQGMEEWVEQCRNGQASVYAKVVKALQPKVLGFLYRMTQNRELAEDIGQEAFLRAFRLLDRYDRKKAAFSTWLFTLARNLCLDELRKSRIRSVSLEEAAAIPAESESNPHRAVQEREWEQRIAEAVGRLEPEYREVFVLREYQNLPLEEIVQITGFPLGTIKSRLHRSRLRLQEILAPMMNDL
ncbi:MAG: sigma-70 family RNA polymerase sigma factor [Candidatus Omnitrophota bacterium]